MGKWGVCLYLCPSSKSTCLQRLRVVLMCAKYAFLNDDLNITQFQLLHWVRIVNSKSVVQNVHLEIHLSQFFDVRHFVESLVNESAVVHWGGWGMFHNDVRFHHVRYETLYSGHSRPCEVPLWHYIVLYFRWKTIPNMSSNHILFRCAKLVVNAHDQFHFIRWVKCTGSTILHILLTYRQAHEVVLLQLVRMLLMKNNWMSQASKLNKKYIVKTFI